MRILFVGNGPRYNRGCEAITVSTVGLLREHFPGVEIEALSFDPEVDGYYRQRCGIVVGDIRNRYQVPPLVWRLTGKLGYLPDIWKANLDGAVPYVRRLEHADLVLSLGGDNYTDDYGPATFYWSLARWARRFGKPFVIWGGSVGPFKTDTTLRMAREGLRDVTMVSAREDDTVDYLRGLGFAEKVRRTYDTAFALEPAAAEFDYFDNARETVGFNISPIFHRYGGKSSAEVLAAARQFIALAKRDCNVLLVPHVHDPVAGNNDLAYMEQLLCGDEGVKIVRRDHSAAELKQLISRCSFFIGARTHATIAAFSSCVPTLSLAYSRKARGITRDLFGSLDYVLEADRFSAEALGGKFALLRERSGAITAQLRERVPMIRTRLSSLVEEIVGGLTRGAGPSGVSRR